jgi:hypothetical protein
MPGSFHNPHIIFSFKDRIDTQLLLKLTLVYIYLLSHIWNKDIVTKILRPSQNNHRFGFSCHKFDYIYRKYIHHLYLQINLLEYYI